jgi:hypothetical protein
MRQHVCLMPTACVEGRVGVRGETRGDKGKAGGCRGFQGDTRERQNLIHLNLVSPRESGVF